MQAEQTVQEDQTEQGDADFEQTVEDVEAILDEFFGDTPVPPRTDEAIRLGCPQIVTL